MIKHRTDYNDYINYFKIRHFFAKPRIIHYQVSALRGLKNVSDIKRFVSSHIEHVLRSLAKKY
jgi:hypothetical protein